MTIVTVTELAILQRANVFAMKVLLDLHVNVMIMKTRRGALYLYFTLSLDQSCLDNCNGHGTCNVSNGECICDDEYSGSSCQSDEILNYQHEPSLKFDILVKKCPEDCNGNGNCNVTSGICNCFINYTGEACNGRFKNVTK